MLGYKPTTSAVHKIISSGKFDKERSFLKKISSNFYVGFCFPSQKVANESLNWKICFQYNNRGLKYQVDLEHHAIVHVFSGPSKSEQILGLSP